MGSPGNLTGIERRVRRAKDGVDGADADVTYDTVIAALGFVPARTAAVSPVPTGTGFRHVTDGAEDGAAAYPAKPPGAFWLQSSGLAIDAAHASDVDVVVHQACTIVGVYVVTQGGNGSCVIDIKAAAFPATPTASICASSKPAIAGADTYSDTVLAGWTTAIAAGTRLRFRLVSSSTFKNISIFLKVA